MKYPIHGDVEIVPFHQIQGLGVLYIHTVDLRSSRPSLKDIQLGIKMLGLEEAGMQEWRRVTRAGVITFDYFFFTRENKEGETLCLNLNVYSSEEVKSHYFDEPRWREWESYMLGTYVVVQLPHDFGSKARTTKWPRPCWRS